MFAVEIANQFPMALAIGTDLSTAQPNWVPPNVQFCINDAESQ